MKFKALPGVTDEMVNSWFKDSDGSLSAVEDDEETGTRTVYCGAMRALIAESDADFSVEEGNEFDWRLQIVNFKNTQQNKANEIAYGEGTGTFPAIPEPEPEKTDDENKDDKTTDETEKDTETTDNASFIAATSLTIGAMTAMLAF